MIELDVILSSEPADLNVPQSEPIIYPEKGFALDVGSSGAFDDDARYNFVMVDTSFNHLRYDHAGDASLKVVADARHLPFKDRSFEAVYGTCVPFCEIPDKHIPQVLEEYNRTWNGQGEYLLAACSHIRFKWLTKLSRIYNLDLQSYNEVRELDRVKQTETFLINSGLDLDKAHEEIDRMIEPRDTDLYWTIDCVILTRKEN